MTTRARTHRKASPTPLLVGQYSALPQTAIRRQNSNSEQRAGLISAHKPVANVSAEDVTGRRDDQPNSSSHTPPVLSRKIEFLFAGHRMNRITSVPSSLVVHAP